VTDLALKVADVLFMLRVAGGICQDISVAVFTSDYIDVVIHIVYRLARAMELITMAFGARHRFLRPVDIGGNPFIIPQVFITNTRAVTGSTVVLH
jgi:hypothetical protein